MIIEVIGAFLAIFAFAVVQEIPKKYLWCAGVVGAVGWLSYLIVEAMGQGAIASTFASVFSIAMLSHIFARSLKAPVTVFLVPGILPTVPGAGMYRIVYYILQGDRAMSGYYLATTLELAGTIAVAIFVVDALFQMFQKGWKQNSLKYRKKENLQESIEENSKIV